MTSVLSANVFGHFAVDLEVVVNEKFVARPDAGECVDEDAIARLDRLAVGCARMVQEAGAVPVSTAIDDAAVRQTKHERMAGLRSLACGGTPPAGQFTLVLDEPLACRERPKRKQSLAMHGGTSCGDTSQSHCFVSLRYVSVFVIPVKVRSISLPSCVFNDSHRIVCNYVQLTVWDLSLPARLRHNPAGRGSRMDRPREEGCARRRRRGDAFPKPGGLPDAVQLR